MADNNFIFQELNLVDAAGSTHPIYRTFDRAVNEGLSDRNESFTTAKVRSLNIFRRINEQ